MRNALHIRFGQGIAKAVLALAVGYAAVHFFAADPWLFIPVGLVAVTLAIWKGICVGRTLVWFVMMGALAGIV